MRNGYEKVTYLYPDDLDKPNINYNTPDNDTNSGRIFNKTIRLAKVGILSVVYLFFTMLIPFALFLKLIAVVLCAISIFWAVAAAPETWGLEMMGYSVLLFLIGLSPYWVTNKILEYGRKR